MAAIVPPLLRQAESRARQGAPTRHSRAGNHAGRQSCPLALVEPYLAALEGLGPHVAVERADISRTHSRLAAVEGERARAGLVPRDGGDERRLADVANGSPVDGAARRVRRAGHRLACAQVAPLPVPKITWRVENSFRFFTDAADTEVHRATFLALPPEDQLQHPILAAEQALSARHEDGWAETMFRDTCWDARTNRFACKDGGNYINPQVAPRRRSRSTTSTRRPALSCTWLTAPHGGDAARRGRHAAVQRGGALRHPLSRRRHGQRRDRRPRGGERRRSSCSDLLIVGMGDSFASGEGNPDVPVRFSRERSADYGKRSSRQRPHRLSGAHRPVEADRRQGLHRGERALDRSGLPPLALFASAARRAAARPRGRPPRRDLRRRRLLGLGGDVRAVPALRRQRVGAQPQRHVADLGHRLGAVRRPRGAVPGSARGLSHGRHDRRAEGRPRAAQVRSRSMRARST